MTIRDRPMERTRLEDPELAPDVSRYGRARKRKTIAGFLVGASYEGRKFPANRSKSSPKKAEIDEPTANIMFNMFSPRVEDAETSEDRPSGGEWRAGDIAWARVGGYPMWPCLVTRDAQNRYVKRKTLGRACSPSYALHVTFFGDNGRHSWISTGLLMRFDGPEEFDRIKSTLTPEMRKRDPKYCASFEIKPGKRAKWQTAVNEAEMLTRRPPELRQSFLASMLPQVANGKRPAKRRRRADAKRRPEDGELLFESLLAEDRKPTLDENGDVLGDVPLPISNVGETHMDRWILKRIKTEPPSDSEERTPPVVESAKRKRRKPSKRRKTKRNIVRVKLEPLSDDDDDDDDEKRKKPKRKKGEAKILHVENGLPPVEENAIRVKSEVVDDENSPPVEETFDLREVCDISDRNYDDPKFRQFFALNKDHFLDENPDRGENDILPYLYNVWRYGDDRQGESDVKSDGWLVKGMSDETPAPPPVRKLKKTTKKRASVKTTTARPRYREDSDESDVDSEEPSKPQKSETGEPPSDAEAPKNIEDSPTEPRKSVVDARTEMYMESLRAVKPSIFRGLVKEKVCEICEAPGNLLKCRGPCQNFYHGNCVDKKLNDDDDDDNEGAIKKKKQKSRRRGRSSEDSADSSESTTETDRLVVSDECFSNFENEMSGKISEPTGRRSPSCEDRDWDDIALGECVIVDAKVKNDDDLSSNSVGDFENAFRCHVCTKYDTPLCSICKNEKSPKSGEETRQRCSVTRCHYFYHMDCLKAWPQTKYSAGSVAKGTKESLSCPKHVCHTCVSDDPRGSKTRFVGDKLARCVRCPATYHCFTQCIPAGTTLLTASQIICPRHVDLGNRTSQRVNTSWCFICTKGGTLVCCETCPTSFHASCLHLTKVPEDGFICEECETGRLPLYEELVWVKLGHYRWWPAVILHPFDVPPNINALPHKPGQFVVRFFGAYDHYWVHSRRVFQYLEDDTDSVLPLPTKKKSLDNSFATAMKQAKEVYVIIKEIKERNWLKQKHELSSSLLPPKYIKLKVNRPVGGAIAFSKANARAGITKCECNPNSEQPCSPDSDCINRMLLIECSPNVCSAGERCCNQAFEKRLYPPLEPSRTPSRGWGLKTLVNIRKGDFVIEYVGEVINEEEFQRRMKRRQEMRDENYYFLTLDKDRMIDAGPKGNLARFMNHSCEPNCETQKWTVNGDTRVGLFALKDIPAESEVTFNYNLACVGDYKKKCLCGTPRCAGFIGAKPKQEEPPPKKPKKTPSKRKSKRKSAGSPLVSLKADVTKVDQEPGKSSETSENSEEDKRSEPEGIDLDVALINKAVSQLEDFGKIENEIYPETDDRKTEKLIKYERSPDKKNEYRETTPDPVDYKTMNGNLKSNNKRKRLSLNLSGRKRPKVSPSKKNQPNNNSLEIYESVNNSLSVSTFDIDCEQYNGVPVSQQNGHIGVRFSSNMRTYPSKKAKIISG